MRFRPALLPLALLVPVAASPSHADDGAGAAPPWMASYEATKDQPIGMDEGDLKTFLDKQLKSDWPMEKNPPWEQTWKNIFLLMTPSWKADVAAFHLAKFEVSNAQWERFLQDRTDTYETVGDETLEELATGLWQLGSAGEYITRGWRILLARNAEALTPVLNPDKDAKWDPMVAQAASRKLPKGLKLTYPRYLPDASWVEGTGADRVWGKLPAEARKRPASFLSWEQAADFCDWAGFHLPTELEWERAARGPEGRWFPWGNTWEPTRACWKKYNEAAMRANRTAKNAEPPAAELPVVLPPGTSGEAEPTTPCAADVDAFPQGATPEGVLNLAGNVSEYTAWRAWKYAGSKTGFRYYDGSTVVARGANYLDRAEIFLSADRNCEGSGGALLPQHAVEGYGFRIAAYPLAGADLTLPLAFRYNDERGSDTPYFWMPPPTGCADRKAGAPYVGFDEQLTAGILERQLAAESPDLVFVTGPATGIAWLPIGGLAIEHVKSVAELQKFATNPDRLVVLGVLTGTAQSGFRAGVSSIDEKGDAVFKPESYCFSDAQFVYENKQRPERLLTREHIGAVLVLDGERIAVYRPNASLAGAAKYREGMLGHLERTPVLEAAKKDDFAPTARMDGNSAVLSTVIPYLDKKGQPTMSGNSPGIRVTIEVPFLRKVETGDALKK